MLFNPELSDQDIEYFWSHVNVQHLGGCWIWLGKTNSDGYGRISVNKKDQSAHRLSYYIANGVFNNILYVLHSCDNPSCVNPKHLFLGTHLDNIEDKVKKNRQSRSVLKQENFMDRKLLTSKEITQINKRWETKLYTIKDISEQFLVSKEVIFNVINKD